MTIDLNELVSVYVDMLSACLPVTLLFGIGNILVNMFTSAFFNGKLRFGGNF